jgi:hypothetical protein
MLEVVHGLVNDVKVVMDGGWWASLDIEWWIGVLSD